MVAPRVKHFLWLTFKGRISTSDYLHSINIGPSCFLCSRNHDYESICHLFNNCHFAQSVWELLGTKIGSEFSFGDGFESGSWLVDATYSHFAKSVIASSAWFIWKNRCDKIFRSASVSYQSVVCRALAHAGDFSRAQADQLGKRLILNNFTHSDGSFLFVSSYWNAANEVSGAGFFCANSNYNILVAGSCPLHVDREDEAENYALKLALQASLDLGIQLKHIFIQHPDTFRAVSLFHNIHGRCISPLSHHIHQLLNLLHCPMIHIIPKTWASPAFKLASFGANLHALNLFFQGFELPRWLMRVFSLAGFDF
ncbi:uncharacterized protein LOC120278516 [Dioscorea cayenensis subsp. rotundata]|uniref:Uncharacterized protein LOC120278516 n=1 Tax=Dioscorea cayennensis subsp. rotundata TaxID=55577 RepID=A0AB40CRS0_DIOCR|nr:uncharacterized protein LOC120278516 [Dioscorea cayenensis subsp. rotundata]